MPTKRRRKRRKRKRRRKRRKRSSGFWSAIGNAVVEMFDFRFVYYGRSDRKAGVRKIGIAKNIKSRWRSIDRSIKGSKEEVITGARVLCAELVEKMMLSVTKFLSVRMPGSGKTEWRWIWFLDPIMVILIHLLSMLSWFIITYTLCLVVLMIWPDFSFVVVAEAVRAFFCRLCQNIALCTCLLCNFIIPLV